MSATRTTCPYCGVGCGVLATPTPEGVEIKGDGEHPANFGRLCSKGSALGETLSLEGRLLAPSIDGRRAGWDEALDLVAARFAETIAEHGPDSVALYVSGQLLIEDYYVANKLMKGFVGSANIDTNSRLCMASSVAGHKRAFGADIVPGNYEDLEQADLVVLAGSNLAWCHPVLFQRLMAARETRGTKIVVIDPRATATSEAADLHLALAPGSDVALFNGLLAHLADGGFLDEAFVAAHTNGFKEALAAARGGASATRLDDPQLAAFYDLFANTERVVTVYSQGVNQSSAGTDKVNAIINCHLATGRIGKPGMGPFSITGQPNAMGGREVGGLANMLAAHMEIDNPEHREIVRDFWNAPRLAYKPGLKAVDLFRAVGDGRVKALWIMGTNPAVSMPAADAVRDAIRACPFVVVSDVCHTDTTKLGRVLLPSAAWGEKDGSVTNSERRISRQRAFLSPPGEARADWRQIVEVARRLGFAAAFDYERPEQIFREYARLTAFRNDGARDLDLGGAAGLDYEAMAPFQWPLPVGGASRARMLGDGRFYHRDGRARFVATPFRAPASQVDDAFPLVLNTGRIRDQWHTMTRTGKAARLMAQAGEPFLEIHPDDARAYGLAPADLAEVESAQGRAVLRVLVTERQRPGAVFAPMHWTDLITSKGRVDALAPGPTDPVSGQPELKFTPVRARHYDASWHGFALSVRRIAPGTADYFALAPARAGFRAELAGRAPLANPDVFARAALQLGEDAEWLGYLDAARGETRLAAFVEGRFAGALFVASGPVAVARDYLAGELGAAFSASERLRLLAGRPGGQARDRGPVVCACFDVGRHEIADAVAGGCASVASIGEALRAGTNCGSCRPEIARMLAARAQPGRVRAGS